MMLFFFVLLIAAILKDSLNSKQYQYRLYEKYDEIQRYIVLYTSYGFHKEYSFWKLYWYIIKVNFIKKENASCYIYNIYI